MAGQGCSLKSSSELCETLSQLNTNAEHWTLADDNKLCNALNSVERWMLENADASMGRMQTGLDATNRVAVLTNNLDTRLASFANSQFIESRVYDEPCAPSAEPASSIKKDATQSQDETMDNLREAVSLGFAMLRSHFKRIDMRPEDFDEDDDPTFIPDPVFEPFDPHLCRPLPYLIGSDEWNASSSAGISDLPVETTEDAGEVVIGLPPFVQPHSSRTNAGLLETQTTNVHDEQRESMERGTAKLAGSADSRRSDHSGLFASDGADEEADTDADDDLFSYNKPSLHHPPGIGGIAKESGVAIVEQEGAEKHQPAPAHKPNIASQAPSLPPIKTGVDAAARNKSASPTHSLAPSIRSETSSANIVQTKGAMFADSDSDGDMFADIVVRRTVADPGPVIPREPVSIPQNPPAPSNEAFQRPNAIPILSKTTALSVNLFDDDSDDDDLFAIPKVSGSLAPSNTSFLPKKDAIMRHKDDEAIKPKVSMRAETTLNSDAFKSRLSSILVSNSKGTVESTEVTNNSANGQQKSPPLPSIVKSRSRGPGRRAPTRKRKSTKDERRTDDESERNSEGTETSPSEGSSARESADRTVMPSEHTEVPPQSVSVSLFSDSDDDIFSTKPKQTTNPVDHRDQTRINGTNAVDSRRINGTNAVDSRRINETSAAAHATEDPAVGKQVDVQQPIVSEVKPPSSSSIKITDSNRVKSIFSSSEDDEDIFAKSAPIHKPSTSTVTSLPAPVAPLPQPAAIRVVPPNKGGGIFDDESDSDEDLFK